MTSRLKNIVLYSANLPPESLGGIETNAFYLIKHLLSTDVRLHVVTQTKKRFTFTRNKRVPLGQSHVNAHLLKKRELGTPARLFSLLERLQCRPDDTVIYHNTLDLHDLYHEIKLRGFTQVGRSGGNDLFFMRAKGYTNRDPLNNIAQLDILFVNSEYSLKRAQEAGLSRLRLRVVKGGCSRGEVAPTAIDDAYTCPIILSCCRLVDFKGLEDAIDACQLLDRQGLNFTYLLIGDGELKATLEKRIERHGLQRKCLLIGSMPPDKVHSYYQLADIYLSSSKDVTKKKAGITYTHTETMGRSLCEAQVYGVPVVSTDAGGSPEMVQTDVTGIIVRQGDIQGIADALALLIRDEQRRHCMGQNAALHAEQNLSWSAVFHQIQRDVEALLNSREG